MIIRYLDLWGPDIFGLSGGGLHEAKETDHVEGLGLLRWYVSYIY